MIGYAYAELEESRGAIQVSEVLKSDSIYLILEGLDKLLLCWSKAFNSASCFLQSAKKIYESLLGDGVNAKALAHIQVIIVSIIRFQSRFSLAVCGMSLGICKRCFLSL